MSEKFYLTTPIYYPNAKPHLGTLYSTLLADIFARWQKLAGKQVCFLTGLDEHGQKIAQAAAAANMPCQDFVDGKASDFVKVWQHFGIEYDIFMRTSGSQHKIEVEKLFAKMLEKDFIYKGIYEGYYCTPCETFVNLELGTVNPLCTSCNRPVSLLQEENYFFRLSGFADRLLEFYQNNPEFITPSEKLNEIVSFVKAGLKDLCVSRKGLTWGVNIPNDPEQKVYVWLDALFNYATAVGYNYDQAKLAQWWPADLHILAKDIAKFHAIYWPAFLWALDLPLPKKLLVHGYILIDQQKMSKSLANAVDPVVLSEKYGVEPVRYYLARHMPINHDGNFSIEELENTINSDLANNLGNLLSRLTSLAQKYQTTELQMSEVPNEFAGFADRFSALVQESVEQINNYQLHLGLASAMRAVSQVNVFVHEQEPWKLAKNNPELFRSVISTGLVSLAAVSVLFWPAMPKKMEEIWQALGLTVSGAQLFEMLKAKTFWQLKLKINFSGILFNKIETAAAEAVSSKQEIKNIMNMMENKTESAASAVIPEVAPVVQTDLISFDDLVKVKLAVGQIKSCARVEKSDKLYRLEVDFGPFGMRQVVSGIAQFYQPEQLLERKCAFVINLAPRKIMGLESQAMILAAKDGKTFTLTMFENANIEVGTLLS